MDKMKTTIITVFTALSAWLGILAVPMLLLILVNVADYGTGLAAAKYRGQKISSYRGFLGIAKKVCMWLLVGVGVIVDYLITYAAQQAGVTLSFGYAVASLVAVWLICNEIISILENISDIGVALPPFLLKLVGNLKSQVEGKGGGSLSKADKDSIMNE
ncbi:holin family protein [Caproicibacter sp.]|uniref:phage holin family protein n=1 Tax=Caproicibacter sp. TaxID=2814884 RepID=UPI003988BB73